MLTFYYAKNSCSFAAHVVLEDANEKYDSIKIDFQSGEQNSEKYKKINFKQRVPALVTPLGILTETTAIMVYIASENPQMNLLPNDNYTLAQAHSFNAYLSSTIHVAHAHKHRGNRWATDEKALANMTAKVAENMTGYGEFIENHLLKGPWVLGQQYSICDPYLSLISRWFLEDGVDMSQLPRIVEHNQRIKERDSMKRVMEIHNS